MCCKFTFVILRLQTSLLVSSTKLDAEKRLALQEEKQSLETKLAEVYVDSSIPFSYTD